MKWLGLGGKKGSLTDGADATGVAVPFAAIVLAMLPAVLDQTILATALPVIAGDLGSVTDVSWVVTAYVVAAAAATPLWGKLGDRHGRKLVLEIALTLFVAASALCSAAQDITQLIVLRLAHREHPTLAEEEAAEGREHRLSRLALPDRGQHLLLELLEAAVEEVLLGGEVVEDRRLRDLRRARDVGHGD